MKQILLIHYGEITLKGKNRHFFEQILVDNVKRALKDYTPTVTRFYGRLTVTFEHDAEAVKSLVNEALQKVPGVANFSWAWQVEGGYDEIEKLVLEQLAYEECDSFAVRAKRTDKSFPMGSVELAVQLGSAIVTRYHKKVDLETPDLIVKVRMTSEGQFVSFFEHAGPAGLPVGTSGKAIALLSAGIDSPVASWMMMTRGANLQYVHFHSYPVTSKNSIDNVKDIVSVLQEGQPKSALHLVALADIQQEIVKKAPPRLRVILYRRAMFDITQIIAQHVGAKSIVTGESLGQVASQTMENMHAASSHVHIPVLRPLIGLDKEAIVRRARHIGTYDISIRPFDDCCSLLMPDSVETQAQMEEIENAIAKIDWKRFITDAARAREVLDVIY